MRLALHPCITLFLKGLTIFMEEKVRCPLSNSLEERFKKKKVTPSCSKSKTYLKIVDRFTPSKSHNIYLIYVRFRSHVLSRDQDKNLVLA